MLAVTAAPAVANPFEEAENAPVTWYRTPCSPLYVDDVIVTELAYEVTAIRETRTRTAAIDFDIRSFIVVQTQDHVFLVLLHPLEVFRVFDFNSWSRLEGREHRYITSHSAHPAQHLSAICAITSADFQEKGEGEGPSRQPQKNKDDDRIDLSTSSRARQT